MIVFKVIQFFLLFFWAYWAVISLFGFGKPRKLREKAPQKRFLLMIPAHNEERVIGGVVENLSNLDYPRHMYDILVIADNSNDRTAEIARNLGAQVLEHTSLPGEPKGKPHAIRYALEMYADRMHDYDAVAVFDADNIATLNYLKEMNNHLLHGERLIQCFLDTKNPNDNWVTLAYATSYYYMNRAWQLAKYRLGLGNAVGGTGFCVDVKLLQEIGWTAESLTEDLEFTMQCLLQGVPATWCHHARVFDEKPTDFWASCIQRLRWARGHWDVCFKYFFPLMWRFIRKMDLRAFDGAMYLINPGKAVLGVMTGAVFYSAYFTNIYLLQPLLPMWMWVAFISLNLLYIAWCIAADAQQKINKVKAVLFWLIFNYTYTPLFVWAFITARKKVWVRTEHSRNLSQEELAKIGM